MDLISRQAAIDALRKCQTYKFAVTEPRMIMLADASIVIENLPSAQPESICVAKVTMTDEQVKEAFEKATCQILAVQPERKKGKWIDKSGGIEGAWNYCSVCGEQAIDLYDFCPNCGADMRGEQHEND